MKKAISIIAACCLVLGIGTAQYVYFLRNNYREPLALSPCETHVSQDFKININIATQQELESLPGIGETIAARIIAYRQSHGPLADIGELKNIKGITNKVYVALVPLITVGG